jgi:hypothetical protein
MTRPPTLWRRLASAAGIPLVVVVTGMIVLGIVSNNSAMIQGALYTLLFVGVLVAIEVPLILRVQRSRQTRRLRSSPVGTLFVAPATLEKLVRPAGNPRDSSPAPGASTRRPGQNRGTLRVGAAGATFSPTGDRHTRTEMALSWQEIAEVTVTPHTPTSANLHVLTRLGQVIEWRAQYPPRLFDALTELQAQWSS